jgi:hypothetical protein
VLPAPHRLLRLAPLPLASPVRASDRAPRRRKATLVTSRRPTPALRLPPPWHSSVR